MAPVCKFGVDHGVMLPPQCSSGGYGRRQIGLALTNKVGSSWRSCSLVLPARYVVPRISASAALLLLARLWSGGVVGVAPAVKWHAQA